MRNGLGINPKLINNHNYATIKPKNIVAFGKNFRRDLGSELFRDMKNGVNSGELIKNEAILKKLKGHFGFSKEKILEFVETLNDRTTTMLIQIRGLRKALKEACDIIAQFPREKEEAVEDAKKTTADYYSKIIAEKDKEIQEAKKHQKSVKEFAEK